MRLSEFFDRLRPHGLTRKQIVCGFRYAQDIDTYETLTGSVEGWSTDKPRIYPSELDEAIHVIRKLRLPTEREL